MKRFLLVLSVIALCVSSAPFFGVSYASAVSAYDELIATTPKLELREYSGDTFEDFTDSWYAEGLKALRIRCEDAGQSSFCAGYNSYKDDLLNGSWYVVRSDSFSYIVVWTNDANATLTFANDTYDNPSWNVSSSGDVYSAEFYRQSSWSNTTPNGISIQTAPTKNSGITVNFAYWWLLSTFETTYPTGYEGQTIPDSIIKKLKYSPNFAWMIDSKGKFSSHTNIFDVKLPQVGGGFGEPNVTHQIYMKETPESEYTLVDESILYYKDFYTPEINILVNKDYKYVVKYSGMDVPASPFDLGQIELVEVSTEFNWDGIGMMNGATYGKTCTTDGNKTTCENNEIAFGKCASLDNPTLINPSNCIEEFKKLMNIMTFGMVGTPFLPENQCRQLSSIGSWFAPLNKEVCPVIPANIRNVVTPFVTLAFAFALILGITRMMSLRSALK